MARILLRDLASRLTGVSNCNRRQLYDYLKFYRTYPQIVGTVSAQLALPPEKLISNLSYSKFKLLADVDDETKRTFYEFECIRGNWSVRELKRQIGSLYYERSGLSKDKKKLAGLYELFHLVLSFNQFNYPHPVSLPLRSIAHFCHKIRSRSSSAFICVSKW